MKTAKKKKNVVNSKRFKDGSVEDSRGVKNRERISSNSVNSNSVNSNSVNSNSVNSSIISSRVINSENSKNIPNISQHKEALSHNDLHKERNEILKGTDMAAKQIIDANKKFSIPDVNNYKFTSDEIIKRLFANSETKKKKIDVQEKTYLKMILKQAGYDIEPQNLKKMVLKYNVWFFIIFSAFLFVYAIWNNLFTGIIIPLIVVWVLCLPLMLMFTAGAIFIFLDYKKYKRKKELEEVWPEYLQLVVANINAGMLIDVALWSAVKPRHQVLAKEIEEVAKQTMTGVDLNDALTEFADKYDSVMVKRTINLLIEGMESGGKIAVLLNKISLDIQDTNIMRKEMSASVMTYAIFITFATVVAAPFLFALSTQLLTIIQTIIGTLGQSSTSGTIKFGGDNVKISDFRIFAYIMLGITSFMSACLIGSIRRGSIKDGLKFIPLFMISTIVIYYISSIILASLFGSLI